MSENKQRADIIATIRFPNQPEFLRRLTPEQAVDLGYQAPVSPAPPAWMVEVAREGGAQAVERTQPETAKRYRSGQHDGMTVVKAVQVAFRLALERGHVVEAREWTEEELLKSAREDAAQAEEQRGRLTNAQYARAGLNDDTGHVQSALQARRNMLKEGAVGLTRIISASVLKEALRQAWDAGLATGASRAAQATASFPNDIEKAHAVSAIIDTLPTREA